MDNPINFDILTYRGYMILNRLGNSTPSYHQIKFVQALISLVGEDNSDGSRKLDDLLNQNSLSREELQQESFYNRYLARTKAS